MMVSHLMDSEKKELAQNRRHARRFALIRKLKHIFEKSRERVRFYYFAPLNLVTVLAIIALSCNTTQPTLTPPTPMAVSTIAPSNTSTPAITQVPTFTATRSPTLTAAATATVTGESGTVMSVVDGDTIDVNIGGAVKRVRYIGMNTPESNQPCYREATNANATLVSGKTVRLVKDVSETDRFGRLLRYVYVGVIFVNAALIEQGYAEAVEYPPDTTQAVYLESLEAKARAENLNCYAIGVFGGVTVAFTATKATLPTSPTVLTATIRAQSTATPTVVTSGNCDPAYPTVCIPPPPPDLDCKDIPYRRFKVLPPDPHRFDGNKDGVGCES